MYATIIPHPAEKSMLFSFFDKIPHDVEQNQAPGESQRSEEKNGGAGQSAGLCADIFLVKAVKRDNVRIQLFHIRLIHCLMTSHGSRHVLNELSRRVSEGGRAVKHGRNEGVLRMIEKKFGRLNFYGVVGVVVLSASCQII